MILMMFDLSLPLKKGDLEAFAKGRHMPIAYGRGRPQAVRYDCLLSGALIPGSWAQRACFRGEKRQERLSGFAVKLR